MPGSQIDAVVFDVGGVLLDWAPAHLYRQLFDDPDEMTAFLAEICTPEWHHAHDLGIGIQESCELLARQHPAHAAMIMAWADRHEDMIAGEIDGTVTTLADIKAAGLACYVLSNMEAETFPVRRDRFGFFASFDGCVISGIEGVAKPDLRIFEILLSRYQLDPSRTAFIDDSPVNIAAAAQLGITALPFTGPEQLRKDLRALGLPV